MRTSESSFVGRDGFTETRLAHSNPFALDPTTSFIRTRRPHCHSNPIASNPTTALDRTCPHRTRFNRIQQLPHPRSSPSLHGESDRPNPATAHTCPCPLPSSNPIVSNATTFARARSFPFKPIVSNPSTTCVRHLRPNANPIVSNPATSLIRPGFRRANPNPNPISIPNTFDAVDDLSSRSNLSPNPIASNATPR